MVSEYVRLTDRYTAAHILDKYTIPGISQAVDVLGLKVEQAKLVSHISGMVNDLGRLYSTRVTPSALQEFRSDLGRVISVKQIPVVGVYKDSEVSVDQQPILFVRSPYDRQTISSLREASDYASKLLVSEI